MNGSMIPCRWIDGKLNWGVLRCAYCSPLYRNFISKTGLATLIMNFGIVKNCLRESVGETYEAQSISYVILWKCLKMIPPWEKAIQPSNGPYIFITSAR